MMELASTETRRLIAAAGLEAMLRSDGALELYESRAEFEASLRAWQAREAAGIACRHLDGAGIAQLQPGLSPRFTHGTFVPGWQSIADPYEYAKALADRVVERGGRIVRAEVRGPGHRLWAWVRASLLRARDLADDARCGVERGPR